MFYTVMKIHNFDENFPFWWNTSLREKWKWKFIVVLETIHIDENSLIFWKFIILMKIQYSVVTNIPRFDKHFSFCYKFIIFIKIYHYDENSLMWRMFPILINILHFVTNSSAFDKICHYEENTCLWWKFMIVMKINCCDEDLSFAQDSSS